MMRRIILRSTGLCTTPENARRAPSIWHAPGHESSTTAHGEVTVLE